MFELQESVGIHSWNTERSDYLGRSVEACRDADTAMPLSPKSLPRENSANHYYLPKDHNSNFDEPSLFEGPSVNGMHRTRSHSPRKERRQPHDEKTTR